MSILGLIERPNTTVKHCKFLAVFSHLYTNMLEATVTYEPYAKFGVFGVVVMGDHYKRAGAFSPTSLFI